jgi:hypothetical protein
MLSTATDLWCPIWFNQAAQIDWWLNHPSVPARKAAATRAELPTMMPARQAQCFLNLYLFLTHARTAAKAPRPTTEQVADLLKELQESGVVEKRELQDLRPHLLKSTHDEFNWHAARCRTATEARMQELMHEAS